MNKKIKVMNHKPEVSDEEIQRYMNFDDVVVKHALAKSAVKAALIKKTLIITIAAVVVVSLVWYLKNNESNEQKVAVATADSTSVIKPDLPKIETAPVTVEPESATVTEQTNPTKEKTEKRSRDSQQPTVTLKQESVVAVQPSEKSAEQPAKGFTSAEPVDGFPALYEYMNKNLTYPQGALKDSIQGVTTVSFLINREGDPEKIEVINSLGPLFDAEARRLIEEMPEWKPAVLHGKPIASRISLPVTFQIVKLKAH